MNVRPFSVRVWLPLMLAWSACSPAAAQEAAAEPSVPPPAAAPAVPAPVSSAVPVAPSAALPENILHLDLSSGGRVTIQLYPEVAPTHVERIKALARQGFYRNVVFHRVIDGFMAQTGDPTGTGQGGSPLPDLKAEFSKLPHLRGTVSMARANDNDSANSQFFIVFQPRFALDNKYTVFGRVMSGMQFVDAIERGEPPTSPSRILQASIASDNVAPITAVPAITPPNPETPVTADQLNVPQSN